MGPNIFTRVADFAHKTVVFGLMGFTGYQMYQIGYQLIQHRRLSKENVIATKNPNQVYKEEVKKHLDEIAAKDYENWSPDFKPIGERETFRPESTKPKKTDATS